MPTGVPTVCLHASGDDTVPIALGGAHVADAGPRARPQRVDGAHSAHLDPGSQAVGAAHGVLEQMRR